MSIRSTPSDISRASEPGARVCRLIESRDSDRGGSPQSAFCSPSANTRIERPSGIGPYLASIVFLVALIALAPRVGLAGEGSCGQSRVGFTCRAQDAESVADDRFGRVRLRGDVPTDDFPDIQRKADAIWSHLAHRLRLGDHRPVPEIHFHPFVANAQEGAWTAWQKAWTRTHPVIWRDWTALREKGSSVEISQEWIDENIDEIFPFPRSFLAFHYDGTNRIQINPARTFRASMQQDPYGQRRDMDGRGYYSMAHEMLHYALELAGVVPTKLHHCLMLSTGADRNGPGIMEQVADHLVEDGSIAPSAKLLGLAAERALAPCSRLSGDELRRVEELHAVLGEGVSDALQARIPPIR